MVETVDTTLAADDQVDLALLDDGDVVDVTFDDGAVGVADPQLGVDRNGAERLREREFDEAGTVGEGEYVEVFKSVDVGVFLDRTDCHAVVTEVVRVRLPVGEAGVDGTDHFAGEVCVDVLTTLTVADFEGFVHDLTEFEGGARAVGFAFVADVVTASAFAGHDLLLRGVVDEKRVVDERDGPDVGRDGGHEDEGE